MNFEDKKLQISSNSDHSQLGDDQLIMPAGTHYDTDSECSDDNSELSNVSRSRSLNDSGMSDEDLCDTDSEDEDYELPSNGGSRGLFYAYCMNMFMLGVGVLVAGVYTKQCYYPNIDFTLA